MPAPKGNQYAKGNKGGGRQSTYKPAYAAQALKACEAGFTDRELASLFGVGETTINQWKLDHQEFADALKGGKTVADDRVERSLYHRAIGYTYDSEKLFRYQGEVIRAPVREHVPPDPTSMIFWLKNRRKDAWRDKHDHEHAGPNGGPMQIEHPLLPGEAVALIGTLLAEAEREANITPPTNVDHAARFRALLMTGKPVAPTLYAAMHGKANGYGTH